MGFGEAIASFYRGYFDFEYRSCRSEFWWSTLFKTLVYFAMVFIAITLGAQSGTNTQSSDVIAGFFMLGVVIFYLVNFIPNLAITVRRFHDQNQSGWMVLLGFIPYVGWLIIFVFMCIDGTHGENRFGEDPLGEYIYDTFS